MFWRERLLSLWDTNCTKNMAEENEKIHEKWGERTMNRKILKKKPTLPTVKYSEDTLQEAIKLIQNGSLSKMDASKLFKIPRQTLQYRLDRSKNQGKYRKQGERTTTRKILKKKPTLLTVKYSQEDLKEAIKLIQDGSLSKTDASKIYNIPRQTLQYRLDRSKNQGRDQKQGKKTLNKDILKKKSKLLAANYSEEDLEEAIKLIQNDSLSKTDASTLYKIPRQTLQYHLDRCKNQGRDQKQGASKLKKQISKKKSTPVTVKYSEELLQEAIKRIKNGTLSKNGASKIYNIPRQTLQYRLGKRFKKQGKGPATVLNKEEEEFLVKWLEDSSRRGFPKTRLDLIKSVEEFIKINPERKTPFTEGRPGNSWLNGFLRRHPDVSFRTRKRVRLDEAVKIERRKIREDNKALMNEIKKNAKAKLNQEQTTASLVHEPIIVHLKTS